MSVAGSAGAWLPGHVHGRALGGVLALVCGTLLTGCSSSEDGQSLVPLPPDQATSVTPTPGGGTATGRPRDDGTATATPSTPSTPTSSEPAEGPRCEPGAETPEPPQGQDQPLAQEVVLREGDLPGWGAQQLPELDPRLLEQVVAFDGALRASADDAATTGLAVSPVFARSPGPEGPSFWVIGQVTVHEKAGGLERFLDSLGSEAFVTCLQERSAGLLSLDLPGVRTKVTSSGLDQLSAPTQGQHGVSHRLAVTFDVLGVRTAMYLEMWNLAVGRCAVQVVVDSVLAPPETDLLDQAAAVMVQRAESASPSPAGRPGCRDQR